MFWAGHSFEKTGSLDEALQDMFGSTIKCSPKSEQVLRRLLKHWSLLIVLLTTKMALLPQNVLPSDLKNLIDVLKPLRNEGKPFKFDFLKCVLHQVQRPVDILDEESVRTLQKSKLIFGSPHLVMIASGYRLQCMVGNRNTSVLTVVALETQLLPVGVDVRMVNHCHHILKIVKKPERC